MVQTAIIYYVIFMLCYMHDVIVDIVYLTEVESTGQSLYTELE